MLERSNERKIVRRRPATNAARATCRIRPLATLLGTALLIAVVAGCERKESTSETSGKSGTPSASPNSLSSNSGGPNFGDTRLSESEVILPDPVAPPETPLPAPDLAMQPEPIQQQIHESRKRVADAPDDPDAAGHLGMLYQAYDMLDAAEMWYRRALQLAPGEFQWHYLLAHVYTSRGDGREAVEALVRSILLRPSYVPAHITLANLLINGGSLDQAIKVIEDARRYDNESPIVAYSAGMVHMVRQEYEQAAAEFESVLDEHPEFGAVRKVLAAAYKGMGRDGDADRLLAGRAENDATPRLSDPVRAEAFKLATGFDAELAKGLAYMQRNDPKTALKHFDMALRFQPGDATIRINKAEALVGLRRFAEAEHVLLSIVEQDEQNVDAWLRLGDVFLMRGKPEATAPIIAMLDKLDPENLTLLALKARYAMAIKNYDAATAAYSALARANPENTLVLMELANARLLTGQRDTAKRAYLRVLELRPKESYVMFRLAMVYRNENDFARADEWFEKAIASDQAIPAYYEEYAAAAAMADDYPRVAEILEAGRRRFPKSADLLLMHARLLAMCPDESVRDYPAALELAQSLKNIAADNPRVIDVLAVALAGSGRQMESVQLLEKAVIDAESALLARANNPAQGDDTGSNNVAAKAPDQSAQEEVIKRLRAHLAAIKSGDIPIEAP